MSNTIFSSLSPAKIGRDSLLMKLSKTVELFKNIFGRSTNSGKMSQEQRKTNATFLI